MIHLDYDLSKNGLSEDNPEEQTDVQTTGEESAETEITGSDGSTLPEISEENNTEAEETADSGESDADEESDTDEESEDDDDSEDEEENRIRICPSCHKNAIPYSHKYCRKCEKKIIKVKIPFVAYIAGILILGASFFAFLLAFFITPASLQVLQGDYYARKNNWYMAYNSYDGVSGVTEQVTETLSENSPLKSVLIAGSNYDMKVYESVVRIFNPLQAFQYKSYVFKSQGAAKYMTKNKRLKEYDDIYNKYNSTYEALSEPIDILYDAGDNVNPELGKEQIEAIEKLRNADGVDEVFLDYFLFNVAGYCNMDKEDCFNYLKQTYEADQKYEFDYSWLYGDEYVDYLIARGEDDAAEPLIEKQLSENVSSYQAALHKCRILFRKNKMDEAEEFISSFCNDNKDTNGGQSDSSYSLLIYYLRVKGEYENAKELIEQAQTDFSLVADYDRQLALIYLIEGDYDKAFEAVYSAEDKANYRYQYYGDTTAISPELEATSYLACYMCKKYGKCNTENAEHIDEILESFPTVPNDTVQKIIDGDLTIENALTEGVYDLI